MKLRLSALALGTTLLVGCASSGTDQQGRSDPLEGFNRTMYNFNFNVLDPYIVRPVAVAWRDYVPQRLRPRRLRHSARLRLLQLPALRPERAAVGRLGRRQHPPQRGLVFR